MKKTVCLLIALTFCLVCAGALADQNVTLPGGTHSIRLPDSLREGTATGGSLLSYYTGNALEVHVFCFDNGRTTLDEYADLMTEGGKDVSIKNVNGTQMICYRDRDETDGASLIAYIYPVEDEYVEIDFFYGTDKAANTVTSIMKSFK